MREYDPDLPLIAIHIPKTGGTSVMELYKEWFGSGFHAHYRRGGALPAKHNFQRVLGDKVPIVIYGHFNKLRKLGIEKYYPDVEQFVTIMRDPFERAVSRFFHFKRRSMRQDDIRTQLLQQKPEWSMFCHFPGNVRMDNYERIIEERFIEIGVSEHLEDSITRISEKLGKKYKPSSVKMRNVSKRDSVIPYDLREEFVEKNPLEYAVYNYVLSKYI